MIGVGVVRPQVALHLLRRPARVDRVHVEGAVPGAGLVQHPRREVLRAARAALVLGLRHDPEGVRRRQRQKLLLSMNARSIASFSACAWTSLSAGGWFLLISSSTRRMTCACAGLGRVLRRRRLLRPELGGESRGRSRRAVRARPRTPPRRPSAAARVSCPSAGPAGTSCRRAPSPAASRASPSPPGTTTGSCWYASSAHRLHPRLLRVGVLLGEGLQLGVEERDPARVVLHRLRETDGLGRDQGRLLHRR